MAKKKQEDNLESKYKDRIIAIKKFMNKNPESLYINNGFYTNKYIYIKDNELSNIPSDRKILSEGYTKILNTKEIENKFIDEFENKKYMQKEITTTEFNKLLPDLKRFGFEQIKIRDGKFVVYDEVGHIKWKMKGETDSLKGFYLDFDYKFFLDILNYIKAIKPIEIKFYSNRTYLMIKLVAGGSVTIYARGVMLEQIEEQKTLI